MTSAIQLDYEELDNETTLSEADKALIDAARTATKDAYAPYSGFKVAAAARLQNGTVLTGTNQENASYPVGICAERTLLATVGAMFPNAPIDTIAITYLNTAPNSQSDKPVAPCGVCRQTLLEYENRTKTPIRLILTGFTGKIIIIKQAGWLLPFSFSASDM